MPEVIGPSVDFVQGLKTIVGHGDPTSKDGLAVHVYTANASMKNRAFCSNDGDMLFVPQVGRLDIQTEFGRYGVNGGVEGPFPETVSADLWWQVDGTAWRAGGCSGWHPVQGRLTRWSSPGL